MTKDPMTRLYEMLHHRSAALPAGEPVPDPLVMTSVFSLPAQPDPANTYGRVSSPTLAALEERLSKLEGAPSLSFPSGMGAEVSASRSEYTWMKWPVAAGASKSLAP